MNGVKKDFLCLIVLCIFLLSSCGVVNVIDVNNVETLKGWSFQYNESTNDYSLFFGLCDKNEKYISADVNVEIRIEDENKNIIYKGTKFITQNDFGAYSSQATGERYLANVRIKASEIEKGTSSSGTVYFTVSDGSTVIFDECNCSALWCLPVKDIQIYFDSLPIELQKKSYDESIESKITITDIQYGIDNSLDSPRATIVISGEKTYGGGSGLSYDVFSYKLYDSEDYLVDSGQVYIDISLSVGDKFKDDSLVIYDLTPGEIYTLQLLSYEW